MWQWWAKGRFAITLYRFTAFIIAGIDIWVFPASHDRLVPSYVLLFALGLYTVAKVLHPWQWYLRRNLAIGIVIADLAICNFFVLVTDGFNSPFLLYSLAPVLTASLLLDKKVTYTVASLSVLLFAIPHFLAPLFPYPLSRLTLTFSAIFLLAVVLIAVLPYLINVNAREHLQAKYVLQERRRLSREIHDEILQTSAAICWQAQFLDSRLDAAGIHSTEAKELVRLAEGGQKDAKDCIELLRNYAGSGDWLNCLKDQLEQLNQDTNTRFRIDNETGEPQLPANVELQLLRICQEALTNVRKHSAARDVRVGVKTVGNLLVVKIGDNGCGFDALARLRDGAKTKTYGLEVMRERAESIGGKLYVVSAVNQGTEIHLEVPITPGT